MARTNKSRFPILGMLANAPMSGYDIKKHMEKSLSNFWRISYGQIYPVLRELEGEGLAVRSVESKEGKPDRHSYTITERGLAVLREWLADPAEPHQSRNETLLKLFFSANVPASESIELIRRMRAHHSEAHECYRHKLETIEHLYKDNPNMPYWRLTLRCGVRVSKAFIEWCDSAIAELEAMGKKEN